MKKKLPPKNNYELIQRMDEVDLALFLENLCKSEAAPYADFLSYLESNNTQLLPKGRKVRLVVYFKMGDGKIVGLTEFDAIILDDNVRMLGAKMYTIYNIEKDKVESIPEHQLEIKEWYPDE